AGLLVHRAGECSLFVAKELVLENVLRQRRAVEREEGSLRSLALGVDYARAQLFARSGLAKNQDAGVGWRHGLDDLVDGAHLFRLARQLAKVRQAFELRGELSVFLLNVELFERLGNERLQTIEL